MKNRMFKVSAFALGLLALQNANAAYMGSYLYCVDANNNKNWKWAKATPIVNELYEDKAMSGALRGTWINGSGVLNKKFQSVLDTNQLFENEAAAKEFCSSLVEICQTKDRKDKSDKTGDFRLVGVSSYAIPMNLWGQISVSFKVQDESGKDIEGAVRTSVCPSREYPYFPNDGGKIYSNTNGIQNMF